MTFPLYSLNYASVEVFHYFPDLPNYIITTITMLGPTIGYLDQLYQMYKTRINEGFSLDTALIILFTNTLRFVYWLFKPYQTFLLGQSIALFVIQLILSFMSFIFAGSGTFSDKEKSSLSYLICYFREFGSKIQNHTFKKLSFYYNIYQCHNLIDFCISLIVHLLMILISFVFILFMVGLERTCFIFILVANLIDPLISAPMFYRVVMLHKIQGISVILIIQMILGDILKLIIYVVNNSGWTFVLGAMIQSFVDLGTSLSFFTQRRSMKTDELEIDNGRSSEKLDI